MLDEQKLTSELLTAGASLVGFADLRGIADAALPYGVSILVALDAETMRGVMDGPTRAYFELYHSANRKLDALAELCAERLRASGYQAVAQTTTTVVENAEQWRTPMPHKTVATRAGLGWIGNSALLVTPEYGSCVRLTSVLTDAPLTCGAPIDESRCGSCTRCKDACPGHAISGRNWRVGVERESFYDCHACRRAARKLAAERLDEAITLCGKCIVVCPYSQAYWKRSNGRATD